MQYLYVGKIVNTHGIKGELRIISDFEEKEIVFKPNTFIYISEDKIKEKITGYRHHKNFEMITLEGYNDINDVLKYKNKKVYIDRDDFKKLSDKILKDDIIGMKAYIDDLEIGIVNDIYKTGINYEVFEIVNGKDKKLIPYHDDFIERIDKDNNKIYFKNGMI